MLLLLILFGTQLDYKKRAVINYHASLRDSSHPERQKNWIHTETKVFLNFWTLLLFTKCFLNLY